MAHGLGFKHDDGIASLCKLECGRQARIARADDADIAGLVAFEIGLLRERISRRLVVGTCIYRGGHGFSGLPSPVSSVKPSG